MAFYKKDIVFIQRDDTNSLYQQVNVSASNAIVYVDSDGHIAASKISLFPYTWPSSSEAQTSFDGNRPIKRNDPVWQGVNAGGESLKEFIENFFFPFISATISINSGTTYYETGSSQTIPILGTITANDETLFGTGSIRRNGVDWYTFPSASSYSTSDSVTGASGITGHSYETFMQYGVSNVLMDSSTKTATFIYPYFWGVNTTPGLDGTALYSALTKTVQVQGTKAASMIGTSTYIYFCFPTSYGDLTSVKDPSGFEVLSLFEYLSSVSVSSTGLASDWTRNYKVYRTILQSDPSGTYTFYH